MPKKKIGMGEDPLDSLMPPARAPGEEKVREGPASSPRPVERSPKADKVPKPTIKKKVEKKRLPAYITGALLEEARDAAYHLRVTLSALTESAMRRELTIQLENCGLKEFPRRSSELPTGRPLAPR